MVYHGSNESDNANKYIDSLSEDMYRHRKWTGQLGLEPHFN